MKKLFKCPKCGKMGERTFTRPVELRNGKLLQTYLHNTTAEMGFRLADKVCHVITDPKTRVQS